MSGRQRKVGELRYSPGVTPVIRRGAPLILFAMAATAATGCGSKEKESLVLAELKLATPGTRAMNLQSVFLAAMPGPTKEYDISSLSGDDTVVLGLYIPGGVTGPVNITATADTTTGCDRYRGTGKVTIDMPGVTKSITITMSLENTCTPDGGTGGGGAGGTTGSAGSGGSTAGSGGTTGTAGRGGTTGSAGTGGTTGAAGRGGTTGSAGTGGIAGSGTAGTGGGAAGTGGSGGGGTTGTGGMAGYPSISGCRSFAHCASSCPNYAIRGIAISRDGRLVASAGNDGRVKIWNFDGHTLSATTTALTGFTGYGVAFSPDGTLLAYTAGTSVRTYTVSGWAASTTYLNDGSSNDLVSVGFTPNGQRIVSVDAIGAAGGDLFVHNVGGSNLPALMAHIAKQPASMAVSPVAGSDGSVGVAVGTYGGSIAALSIGATAITGPTVLAPSTANAAVWAVGFTVDGKYLAMGDDYGVVRLWAFPITSTTAVGSDITFAGGDTINGIAFSPNGMYLAVGGAFSKAQLSIYTLSTRAESARSTPAADINALVFSPDGASLIAGEDANATVIVCN
jgi:hypothetical protein